MADEGYAGEYSPRIIDKGSLVDLRKIAGPSPALGKKWVMVNLDTGELKWYQARKRSYGYGGGGGYRPSYRPQYRKY